ncbi:hypothetical protein LEL_05905 [Akanthomyces lecanii RCEF 1005]|uniref:Rhodopsin domain-containing protein n=1 Tax=Akanthomyces lecanii RCEF 1005 TaxID=1081108 RepID=A0A168GA19_CORDF|nr:hypothetical protein LEL_05905 [Akanthomyces lecanii RCEF 1005]
MAGAMLVGRLAYKQFFSVMGRLDSADWSILAATLVCLPSIAVNVSMAIHGLGKDIWGISPHDLILFGLYFYVIQILYIVLMGLIKISLTLFYLTLFPGRTIRTLLWGTVCFHAVFTFVFAMVVIFQCLPVSYQRAKYDLQELKLANAHCMDINASGWSNAAITLASDVWLIGIPLSQIRKLRLHWKKKVGATLMFLTGAGVTIVSILRLQSIRFYANTTNPTRDQFDIVWYSTIEVGVGLICTCMPAMRLVLDHVAPQIFGSGSRRGRDGKQSTQPSSSSSQNQFAFTTIESNTIETRAHVKAWGAHQVGALVDRLDEQFRDQGNATTTVLQSRTEERPPAEPNPAPVILIREAATDAGVSPPGQFDSLPNSVSDVISAVRHTTQELADELAPRLFREAKSLVSKALLVVPQPVEHFQAILILSLWSTTIGQQPLSIDGWLLTGYALQQGFASACFPDPGKLGPGQEIEQSYIDAWCLWNHLCVAHLQYCVGTRRQAMLNQDHVDRCSHLLETGSLKNYEARMVAEVKLYWVIYTKCCPQSNRVDLQDARVALQNWKKEWASLFDEPRSQFLQMGFHFAHLLAYYQSARSPQSLMDASIILEMIDLASTIINLAMDTTDDRTRHLTDHIYHLVSFSALTLCRLVHMYEGQLRIANVDVDCLDCLVTKLVTWFRSIGLPCHAAHLLSDIVSSQFQKLRPNYVPADAAASTATHYDLTVLDASPLPSDVGFYPDLIGSELFDVNEGMTSWPQWS